MSARKTGDLCSLPSLGGDDPFHILLAEDNLDDALLWSRAIKQAGIERPPFVVHDGVEAVEFLAGADRYADRSRYPFPHLLLLDLAMPKLDGFGVLEWWKSTPRGERLTIVVLTGSAFREDIYRAYNLGAVLYLMKPYLLAEVTELVRRALGYCRGSPALRPAKSTCEPPSS
jgi:CheY-like chemotaxis protein